MNKKLVLALFLLVSTAYLSKAQTGISAAGTAPDAAAMLDVIATDKGFMVPRVALTALNAAGPVTGLSATSTSLLVYNTATAGTAPNDVTPGFYYWNNATTSWIRILSGSANPVAGNDIDFGTSASGSIDVEPILNFVHTINAPAANNLNLIPPAGFKVTVNNLNPGTTGLNEVFSVYNGAGGASPTFYLTPSGRAIANDWYYSSGNTGWFNSAWGGGWYMNDATAIKSYGSKDVRILDNTTTLVVDGLTTGGTYNTAAGANTNIMYVNNSTGKVYSLPASNNSVLSTDGSGVPAWTSPASLGVKWNALIDPDGALTLNHGTNATTFNFTNTTTSGWGINYNSLTSGTGLTVGSTATALTGTLAGVSLTGNAAANTGNVFKVSSTGASNQVNTMVITHGGNNIANTNALRINDDGTDTDPDPMIVNYAGNVGIGTTDVSNKLEVHGTAAASINLLLVNEYAGYASQRMRTSKGTPGARTAVSTNDFIGDIVYEGYDGNSYEEGAGIRAKVEAASNSTGILPTGLYFRTRDNVSTTSATTNMVINNTGNVGIGSYFNSNLATSKLHIDGGGTGTAVAQKFTAGTTLGQTATDGFDLGVDASGNAEIRQRENLPMMLYTNNAERVRILAGGNVGIGIAAPYATLTNNGSTAFTTLAVANLASGGAIGTAAATVDIYTTFNVTQTTAGQTLSLPSPTFRFATSN